ncbi:hypothetical protein MUU48_10925 [Scandinavium sp. H11S7]|uniref:Uncharacterized protein n=1 Tax=Scandinavium hiltneri TaxID=2926519 RepID=A0ABT2E2J8_9ENTR|nr:hypothetical protein [Scandinavium hiltneri]MCS2157422.1 hypothetical protein [Scandinavium hiltneri]MCS2162106.1 hypothetical protein [Scandinavium hiltneri]
MLDIEAYSEREKELLLFVVNRIANNYKNKLLIKSVSRMNENGIAWQKELTDQHNEALARFKMMSQRTQRIKDSVGTLAHSLYSKAKINYTIAYGKTITSITPEESAFYKNMMSITLFCTHITKTRSVEMSNKERKENSPKLQLKSLHVIRKTGLPINTNPQVESSREQNSTCFGNDDFVFFSLECGTQTQKPSSRFGRRVFRTPVTNDCRFKNTLIILNDLFKNINRPEETIKRLALSESAITLSEPAIRRIRRRYMPVDVIAVGNINNYITCSVILAIRTLPPDDQRKLLAIRKDNELNLLINIFFRPQIAFPQFFNAWEGEYEFKELKN